MAPWGQGGRVFSDIDHEGVRARGRHRRVDRHLWTSEELIEVDVVAEGEQCREYRGITEPLRRVARVEGADQGSLERATDRDGLTGSPIEKGEL